MNGAVSVLSMYCIERRNESHFLPDLSFIRGVIYFLLANDLFGIDLVQSEKIKNRSHHLLTKYEMK